MKTFIEYITESPELVSGTEFGLDKRLYNRELLHKLLKKKQEVIIDSDDFEVFRTGSDRNGNILMHNKKDDLIDYFVAYEHKNYPHVGNHVTQVKLWRSVDSPYAYGITEKIFMGYLLNKYNAIMSDAQQTQRGREFWRLRMGQASEKGYRVGLANLNTKEVNWFDKTKKTYKSWIESVLDSGWGTGNKYQAMRFVISN